jgi:CBS domain containing-hemolysin-like protein
VTNPWFVLLATIGIIAASAFFVAVEFALIAVRRTRLEEAAGSSRSARAALRSSSEVSVLLAGCQLGITACTLALGAVTKPAVEYALSPVLESLGLPGWIAGTLAFALSLFLVTFLHLVVGEMMPKSWAISHPELSATMLALPMRGFMWVFRPVLLLLNAAANALVRRSGVEPVDEVAVEQDPDDLRQLVRHSAEVGALDQESSGRLSGALDLVKLTVGELEDSWPVAQVPHGSTVRDVQRASRESGRMRVLVGTPEEPQGVVHVRDTLGVAPDAPLTDVARDCFDLDPDTTLLDAMSQMRDATTQIAVVTRGDGSVGLVSLVDVLRRLFPDTATEPSAAPV